MKANKATVLPFSPKEEVRMVNVERDMIGKKFWPENISSFNNYTHTVLNSTREAIFLLDKDGNINIYNEYARRLILEFTGSDIETMKNLIDAVPEVRKADISIHLKQASKGQLREYEVKYPGDKWLEVCFFPVLTDDNIIKEICCTLRDITEKKKSEMKIKESEEMYRSVFESMAEGIVFQSIDYSTIHANDRAASILGVDKELILKKGLLLPGITWIDQKNESIDFEKTFCRTIRDGCSIRNIVIGVKKQQNITWLSINGEPIKSYKTQDVHGCVFTFTDITETIKSREELNLLSRMVKETSNLVVLTNREGKITWANDSFVKTSEYTLDEVLNKKPGQLLRGPEKDRNEVLKMQKGIKKAVPVEGEILNYSKTGKKYWVHYNIHPVKDDLGQPVKFFSIQSDITELKRIQEVIVKQRIEVQSQIAHAIIKGQEDKQTEIGQELHDNINQILGASKMNLSFALNTKKDNKEVIKMVIEYIQTAIDEIRKLSHHLVAPRFQETSLALGLELMIKNIESNFSINVNTSELKEARLDPNLKLTLFRIVQEQLNNIIKHSHASMVNLNVKTDEKNILLMIEDNGVGFDTTKKSIGIGINNICNRAESFCGKAKIVSSRNNGCKLEVIIPLILPAKYSAGAIVH